MFRTVAITIFLLASSAANAAFIRCDGCSAEGYKILAIQAGAGTHVVYDLFHNQAATFNVLRDYEHGGYLAISKTTESGIIQVIDAMSAFHRETGGSMVKAVEFHAAELGMPGLGGGSAYDILHNSNLRTQLGDRLAAGLPSSVNVQGWNNLLNVVAQTGASYVGLADHASIKIKITLDDGSSVVFELEVGDYSASYVPGSARTSDGQFIPEANEAASAGTWNFTVNASLQQWITHMQMLGVQVTAGSSGRYSCSWDGRTLSCKGA